MYTYEYPRAALTTDAIVFAKEERKEKDSIFINKKDKDGILNKIYVLLIQRAHEPFLNEWALPGGFVELDETLETACKRELKEETGLVVDKMMQFKTYDAINRDPRHRTISVVYFSELHKKEAVKGGDDAASAEWFPISDLPELAFDHASILSEFFELIKI